MFLWDHNKDWIGLSPFFDFLCLPFDKGVNEQQIETKDEPQEGGSKNQTGLENLSTESSVPKKRCVYFNIKLRIFCFT